MCSFFSAILLRNGDLLHHWNTDSHSELIMHFKLPDDSECRHFAKIEFTPPRKDDRLDFADVDGYTLKIDETTAPQWAEEMREQAEKRRRSIVRDMLITDRRELIIDGCWIAADIAEIVRLRGGRVLSVYDSARVGSVYGSASVGSVSDSASIGVVSGSASVGVVYGSASVVNDNRSDEQKKANPIGTTKGAEA